MKNWFIHSIVTLALSVSAIFGPRTLADEPTTKPQTENKLAPRPVVTLNENVNYGEYSMSDKWGLTALELYRQAFLLVAREDFGLATRDPLLGEEPAGDQVHRFVMEFEIVDKSVFARLSKVAADGKAGETPVSLKLPFQNGLDYSWLSATALKNESKEFAAALEKSGLSPLKDRPPAGQTEVPASVLADLNKMTFPPQFSAVRQLHEIMRAKGPSPELVAGLVRGYANLGILSEVYFTPMHRAFKARSLLYADKLVQQMAPGTGMAHRHKAYALALLGRPGDALQQIEKAEAAGKAEQAKGPMSPLTRLGSDWITPVRDFCRYRTDLLAEQLKEPAPQRELVALLLLLAQEHGGTKSQRLEAAQATLRVSPECHRAVATMCTEGGVSVGHMATQLGDTILRRSFKQRVARIPGLPSNVAALVPSGQGGILGALFGLGGDQEEEDDEQSVESRVKLYGALRDAGRADDQELTWGVLARLLREELFVEVYSRADFLRHSLGVPADDYVQFARPLVADHPFVTVIDSFSEPPGGSPDAISAPLKKTPLENPEPAAARLILRIYREGDAERGKILWNRMLANGDIVTRDIAIWLELNRGPKYMQYWTNALMKISPSDPLAAATRVRIDWAKVEPQAETWELKEFAHSALVLGAFAEKYYELKRWDDVQRVLKKSLTIAPNRRHYEWLADSYLKEKDEAKWLETLEEYLRSVPDYGLDHAGVRSNIADHFMAQKEYEKALPYALDAAETWAAWGMQRAVDCHTGLEDWENAELWQRRIVERYAGLGTSISWFVWCRMTGHGDIDGAKAFFEERLAELGHAPTFHELDQLLLFNMLDNQPKEALAVTQQMLAQTKTDNLCWYCAILSDELGDTKLRDSSLQDLTKIKDVDAEYAQATTNLLTLLGDSDKKFEPDPKMLAEVKSNDVRSQLAFFIGYLLQTRKQNDLARKFYQLCVDQNVKNRWSHKIAVTRLREMASE